MSLSVSLVPELGLATIELIMLIEMKLEGASVIHIGLGVPARSTVGHVLPTARRVFQKINALYKICNFKAF